MVKRSLCNSRCTKPSTQAIWHTLCHWDCQKNVKKKCQRKPCNSRSAIGIRDAETFEKGYMAHAVPLVVTAVTRRHTSRASILMPPTVTGEAHSQTIYFCDSLQAPLLHLLNKGTTNANKSKCASSIIHSVRFLLQWKHWWGISLWWRPPAIDWQHLEIKSCTPPHPAARIWNQWTLLRLCRRPLMPCHKLHVPAHLHASLATPLFKKGMARFLQTNGQFFC